MVTICLLIAIGAIVYYYLHAHPRPSEPKCKYGCPVPKPKKPAKPSNVIWNDNSRLLSFEVEQSLFASRLRLGRKDYRYKN